MEEKKEAGKKKDSEEVVSKGGRKELAESAEKRTEKIAKKEIEKEKSEEKNKTEPKRKYEAVIRGRDLHFSTKQAVAICRMIQRKRIDEAVKLLEEVINGKRAVPMMGEIPHRKGIMSGRYPIKAAKEILKLVRSLEANANMNNMEIENSRIECKADKASRPLRRFGRMKAKRSHVFLKLVEKKKDREEEKIKKEKR